MSTASGAAAYPEQLDVRPLTTWPGTLTRQRIRSPYKAKLATTLDELGRELRALGVYDGPPRANAVLEVAIDPRHWRVDGKPYVRAQAEHPGIVLSLPRTDVGPLRFAADRYDDWRDNLRAVVLTMEALRAVERHGAVRAREQYRGFAALESGIATGATMSHGDALGVLWAASEHPEPNGLPLGQLVKLAKARAHPDRHGGHREAWDRVEAALKRLELLDA